MSCSRGERLTDTIYENLAEALDKLPNGFPRTPSKVEIRILKKLFSPEEASLAGQLSGSLESAEETSARTGLSTDKAKTMLVKMTDKIDNNKISQLMPGSIYPPEPTNTLQSR